MSEVNGAVGMMNGAVLEQLECFFRLILVTHV